MHSKTITALTTNGTDFPRPYAVHYTTSDRFDFHHPLVEFRTKFAADLAALLCIRSLHVDMGNGLTIYHSHEVFGPDFDHRFIRVECLHDLGRERVEKMFSERVRFSPRACQHLLCLHEASNVFDAGYEGETPAVSSTCEETLSLLQHLLVEPARDLLFLVLTPAWQEAPSPR